MEDIYLNKALLHAADQLAKLLHQDKISIYLTGLAASGKSAVAEIVSQLTGIPLVDSGLPFRLAAYLCEAIPACVSDLNLFEKLLNAHSVKVINGTYRIFSGLEDLTDKLRSPDIERDVPRIAGDARLREMVLKYLRSTTDAPSIVAARGATEPLTSGSLLQIELKCDFDERVSRRVKQVGLDKTTVRRSIRSRDARDLQGPSRYPSSDTIDSTHLTLAATVSRVIDRAIERLARLHEHSTFRRVPVPSDDQLDNPFLLRVWGGIEAHVSSLERANNIPAGHTKARLLLHLSRFSTRELVGVDGCDWTPGSVALNESKTLPMELNTSLLYGEVSRIIDERRLALDEFLRLTLFGKDIFESPVQTRVKKSGKTLVAEAEANGYPVEHLQIKDASLECGAAIERYLHYLAIPRLDSTHRLTLVESSTGNPVLYASFSPNTRKYLEPLLWAFGLRMEEVAVAVRGFGTPRCPKNAMGLFLRMCCRRVSEDFRHLKAIVTDINPNWGFSGGSFREAGFITVALKYAPTYFVGDEYVSRRGIEGRPGQKAATSHKCPLNPTLIMIKPLDNSLERQITANITHGLYIIPRNLYDGR